MNVFGLDSLALHSLVVEAKYEFLRLLRVPGFSLPTILFPLLSYALFSSMFGAGGRTGYVPSHYLLASYCVFGVISPGLFGFGVVVALERERGLLRLKRALPMPPANYLLAKLAMAMLFAFAIFVILSSFSMVFSGVRLAIAQWLMLALVCVIGVVPFCALGLFVGSWVSGQAAPAVVNLIYLPMAFLAGLAVPIFLLPTVLQQIAPVWPAYHLAQLAQAAVGQPARGGWLSHVLVLLLVAVACSAGAYRRFNRADALAG